MKKEIEKILLRENKQTAQLNISRVKSLKLEIEKNVVPAFDNLNIGELNTELLNDALIGDCNEIKAMVRQQGQKDIESLKSTAIRVTLTKGIDTVLSEFAQTCNAVQKLKSLEMLNFIFVDKNEVKILPDAESVIIAECKEYIDDEKELAIYNALLATIKGINEFTNALGKNAADRLGSNPFSQIFSYITSENGKLSIDAQNDYKSLTK